MAYGPPAASRRLTGPAPPPLARGTLPRVNRVLAVIARPGQESADPGALLYAFRRAGAGLALVCLTRGEAPPLNSTQERLGTRRPWEGVPVVARMLPGARSGRLVDLGPAARPARAVQRAAVKAHASQSGALAEAEYRLDLMGDREMLRWLSRA